MVETNQKSKKITRRRSGRDAAAGRFRLAAEPAPCWLGDVRRSGTEGAGGLLCERGRAVPCPTVWTASGGRVSFWAEDEGPATGDTGRDERAWRGPPLVSSGARCELARRCFRWLENVLGKTEPVVAAPAPP